MSSAVYSAPGGERPYSPVHQVSDDTSTEDENKKELTGAIVAVAATLFYGTVHLFTTGAFAAGGAIHGAIYGPSAGAVAGTSALVAFVAFPVFAGLIHLKNEEIIGDNAHDILQTIGSVASAALGFGVSFAVGFISLPGAIIGATVFSFVFGSSFAEHFILNNVNDEYKKTAACLTAAAKVCLVIAGVATVIALGVVSPFTAVIAGLGLGLLAIRVTLSNYGDVTSKDEDANTDPAAEPPLQEGDDGSVGANFDETNPYNT